MNQNIPEAAPGAPDAPSGQMKQLPPAALRALAEADERRAARDTHAAGIANGVELGGRKGPDPVRYQDWENNGIASDF